MKQSGAEGPAAQLPMAECAARVLVVDNHPVNRLVVQEQVAALGYSAETAADGTEALRKWRSEPFDLVLTDCNLPGMDGYALAREIRGAESREGRTRTPMIACTANAMSGESEKCFAAGMDDCLAKPVELARLADKLRLWLADPRDMPVMNETALAEIAVGAAMRREVLVDFRRYNDADALALEVAVEAGDLPKVVQAAHRIKGATRTVGAEALAAVVDRIERASRAGDWNATTLQMDAFRRELGRLNAHIDSLETASLTPHHAGEPR